MDMENKNSEILRQEDSNTPNPETERQEESREETAEEKLEERIEAHKLYARCLVNLLSRDDLEIFVHHTFRMRVAIAIRAAQWHAVFANQHEVHPPRVDADAVEADML